MRPYTVAVPRTLVPGYQGVTPRPDPVGDEVVLVPVKAFEQAKRRLAPTVPRGERARLARAMASHVVSASAPLSVAVVCDDIGVARWAAGLGARVLWEPGEGLNGAVRSAVRRLGNDGARWVTVAHGDLPYAKELGTMPGFDGITLVPDRYGNGTNVIAVPADAGFQFSYGPGSFARHRAEAGRLGLPLRVLDLPDLAWDVDEPGDVVPVTVPGAPLA